MANLVSIWDSRLERCKARHTHTSSSVANMLAATFYGCTPWMLPTHQTVVFYLWKKMKATIFICGGSHFKEIGSQKEGIT